MAQHDMNIANQSFPDFRTDLNNALSALNSMHSGTSRPSGATTGTLWLDTTNSGSNSLELKFFDGTDDISFATVNTSANTINFIDSAVASDLVNDTSPQLGGDLDTNSFNITIDDAHFIKDENGNEQLIFQTTASAVNELEITNGATGNGPILGASGETNVDLNLKPKGSGKTIIGSGGASATLTSSGAYDLVLDTNSGTNSGNITITDGANGNIDVSTNGTGYIKFNDLAYIPQQALTSSSNAVAWDVQAKPNAYHLTTENTTFSAPSNSVEGSFICLEINYNGSHTIAFNTVFEFAGSTAPTFTSTDGKTDILVFRYNGAVWQEVGRTLNLSES
tara:strand:- start:186 stop:1193 length:1008 start_codon:yes stop_codon:yes gene_type:complete